MDPKNVWGLVMNKKHTYFTTTTNFISFPLFPCSMYKHQDPKCCISVISCIRKESRYLHNQIRLPK